MKKLNPKIFQDLILILQNYWVKNGCIIIQSFDMEVGAGTLHPMTYFRSLGSKPISIAYIQPSRRPVDGRYGKSQNRLQHYYQFQVILKPTPQNIQELYLKSLKEVGINLECNDLQFIEDNWENPTLGAFGLGWEVRLNGTEITQFTYFQKMGGLDCFPITGEITYGLERLSMHLQKVDNIFDIIWGLDKEKKPFYYRDILYKNEIENSIYNFKYSNINFLLSSFEEYEKKASELISLKNPLLYPAYELILKAIHAFNLLESRKIFSVIERKNYILRIYSLSKRVAQLYLKSMHL